MSVGGAGMGGPGSGAGTQQNILVHGGKRKSGSFFEQLVVGSLDRFATGVHPLDVISVSEAMCPASLHALYIIVDSTDRVNTQDMPNASIQSPALARVDRV
eukprot:13646302-Ditylum_brightwellii.AAC.1